MLETDDLGQCDAACPCAPFPRRDFLKLGGVAAAGLAVGALPIKIRKTSSGTAPQDKGLAPEWHVDNLSRGRRETYSGSDLRFIGMPVGGICAGEVLVGGDGQLWLWDIFNRIKFGLVEKSISYAGRQLSAGDGANYIQSPDQLHPFAQGFALGVDSPQGHVVKAMNSKGWKDIGFTGEYPVAFNTYRDEGFPVQVDLETYSPYIPLDSDISGLPATVQTFTVRNTSGQNQRVRFGGWIENPVCLHSASDDESRLNRFFRSGSLASIECTYVVLPPDGKARHDIHFEDFEKPSYTGWSVVGEAFGPSPIEKAKMPAYQGNVGGQGKRVACSFNARNGESVEQGDAYKGKLISRAFAVDRRFIGFYIGGGNHPGTCCINLLIEGMIVRTATGKDREELERSSFEVSEFQGKQAHLEIVDDHSGPWGHITVDDIVFSDLDPALAALNDRGDYGDICLSLLNASSGVKWRPDLDREHPWEQLLNGSQGGSQLREHVGKQPVSGLSEEFELEPGEQKRLTFAWTWRFPNLSLPRLGLVKNHYSTRFRSAKHLAEWLAARIDDLESKTRLWHDTWYDSTLPHWLLDRVMGNNATLATMTSVRFGNGRFYGWEGIGCCEGTCGHVWAYAQGPARLFPDLERSVREVVDFGVAFHEDSGIIEFRGEYGNGYATDAQGGYVLRALREHQMSKDSTFLARNYPRIKKALQYLIAQDANEDGIIENAQHNTLDVDLYGASSWLSSIYLAALRAGAQMADEMGDTKFVQKCNAIAEVGGENIATTLWNGQYFIQKLDLGSHTEALRYGDGCEVDQVMGQWWSWQLGLPRVLPKEKTHTALQALYRYNFLSDVGPYRAKEKPGRWYAVPGESGLLMCTFPKGDKAEILGKQPTWASGYFNECMTGFEYEAAAHMISEGLVKEGMAVTRAVHDRYHPRKRNPWNEVECSDHYARCMAVHSVYIALGGYEYHGPSGHIGFAPRITPESFRAAFTAAEGWGTYEQSVRNELFSASYDLRHGRMSIKTVAFELPEATQPGDMIVRLVGKTLKQHAVLTGSALRIEFSDTVTVEPGKLLAFEVRLQRAQPV